MKRRDGFAIGVMAAVLAVVGVAVGQEGPNKDPGATVARPRKPAGEAGAPAESTDQPKIPSRYSKKDKPEIEGTTTFKTEAELVSVDVAVLDNKGHFIPNIPRATFRVLEDNVPQQVKTFSTGEAPMTVCMVIEFSNRYQQYWSEAWYQTLTASYGFLETLKPDDYVAIVAYDMRSEILSDFSADKRKAYEAMQRLRIAAFSESNLYDAVTDTAERMKDLEGRKAIVLIASGVDTFSKLTFDKTRKILQDDGVPIYAVGLMQALREWYDSHGMMGSLTRLDFLQADNQMRTFANETGGQAFFPRFYGEFPGIYQAIAQAMRNQYTIGYDPSNKARDGKFRHIKVELVNPATGEPLRVTDQKGKPIKYKVIAKNGYTAPREVE
jgi:Ca-activated chloride channel homolog